MQHCNRGLEDTFKFLSLFWHSWTKRYIPTFEEGGGGVVILYENLVGRLVFFICVDSIFSR